MTARLKRLSSRFKAYLYWLFVRGWPVWSCFAVTALHIIILSYSGLAPEEVHSVVSLVTQVLGAVVVVMSISSNFTTIRNTTLRLELLRLLREYWDARPRRRAIDLAGRATVSASSSATATVVYGSTAGRHVDARIDILEGRIQALRTSVDSMDERFTSDLKLHKQQAQAHIDAVKASVAAINSTVDEVTVGGLHVQMVGLFLLVYSAVTDYLA